MLTTKLGFSIYAHAHDTSLPCSSFPVLHSTISTTSHNQNLILLTSASSLSRLDSHRLLCLPELSVRLYLYISGRIRYSISYLSVTRRDIVMKFQIYR